MNRRQLEHIIRAAGEIAKVDQVIILGSQSIWAQFPNLPVRLETNVERDSEPIFSHIKILTRSMEADVMVPGSEALTERVEAVIGELSNFHDTFGY